MNVDPEVRSGLFLGGINKSVGGPHVYVTVRIDIQKIYTLTSKYICSLTDLFMSIFSDHISEFRKVFWLMFILSGTVSKVGYKCNLYAVIFELP